MTAEGRIEAHLKTYRRPVRGPLRWMLTDRLGFSDRAGFLDGVALVQKQRHKLRDIRNRVKQKTGTV